MSTTMQAADERTGRPAPNEHAPYYSRYIDLVPAGDIVEVLRAQIAGTNSFLRGIPDARTLTGYAPGKWSIRDVVGHMSDTERIMGYRALRFARGDRTPVPGFDENEYTPEAGAAARTMNDLVSEFETVRAATIALLEGLPMDAWRRIGTANGKEISVRALAAVIAGHELHHLGVIRERYLA